MKQLISIATVVLFAASQATFAENEEVVRFNFNFDKGPYSYSPTGIRPYEYLAKSGRQDVVTTADNWFRPEIKFTETYAPQKKQPKLEVAPDSWEALRRIDPTMICTLAGGGC